MITQGKPHPLVYELRLTAHELDLIIRALRNKDSPTEDDIKFLKDMEKLSDIRTVRGLRRYGIMDEMRLNWK